MVDVYPPAEDSHLLEECILREHLKGARCCDMGTGSGIQGVAMACAGAREVVCVDINPDALAAAKEKTLNVGLSKKVSFVFKKSNLFSALKGKEAQFDCIAFNPPYVPSDEKKWVDLDGGLDGREVIDRFIHDLKKHVTREGIVLLLLSSLNGIDDISTHLTKQGFVVKVVGRKKLFFEELVVLRAKLL